MIRKNWFRNAACRGDGAKPSIMTDVAANGLVWRWAGRNGWCATSKEGTLGSFVEWALNVGECAGKPMVFACEIGYVGPDASRGEVVQIVDSGGAILAQLPVGRPAQRKQLFRFTAPADGNLRIRFRGPRGDGDTPAQLAVYTPQLELAETYVDFLPVLKRGDSYAVCLDGGWQGTSSANGEKWRYEKQPNYNAAVFAWWYSTGNALMSGKILYARITAGEHTVIDNLEVENADTIVRRDGWIAARVADDNTDNHTLPLKYGPLVLQEVGCYSPEDWEQLYALYQKGDITYPWVAGPRNATMAGEIGPWEL